MAFGVYAFGPFNIARPFLLSHPIIVPAFAHASGSVGTRATLKSSTKHKSPGAYLLASLRKDALYATCPRPQKPTSGWSLTWAIATPMKCENKVELVNIDLNEEAKEEQNRNLEATLVLRAAPTFTSLSHILTACKTEPDFFTVLGNLLRPNTTSGHWQPPIVATVVEELREAGCEEQIVDLHNNCNAVVAHRCPAVDHTPINLALRRGKSPLLIEDLAPLEPRNYMRCAETMLCYKVIEDPDFPLMAQARPDHAAWSNDYNRDDFDIPAGILSDVDFFSHPIFVQKLKIEVNKRGKMPAPPMIKSLKRSAARELGAQIDAELQEAKNNEHERVIQCKIEPFLDSVAETSEEKRKIRKIRLQALVEAGIDNYAYYDKNSIEKLLRLGLDQILAVGDHAGIEERLISDIISVYSADLDEEQWNQKWTADELMNEPQRKQILNWIVDEPFMVDIDLATGEILEELSEGDLRAEFEQKADLDRAGDWLKLSEGDNMFIWPLKLGEVDEEADEAVELPKRETGFYTNMLSSLSSESEEEDDEESEPSSPESSGSDEVAQKVCNDDDKVNMKQPPSLDRGNRLQEQIAYEVGQEQHPTHSAQYLLGEVFSAHPEQAANAAGRLREPLGSRMPLIQLQQVGSEKHPSERIQREEARRNKIREDLRASEDAYVARMQGQYTYRKSNNNLSGFYRSSTEQNKQHPDSHCQLGSGYRQARVNEHGQLSLIGRPTSTYLPAADIECLDGNVVCGYSLFGGKAF